MRYSPVSQTYSRVLQAHTLVPQTYNRVSKIHTRMYKKKKDTRVPQAHADSL